MDATALIIVMVVLLIILLLLVVVYLVMRSHNIAPIPSSQGESDETKPVRSFEELSGVLKNRQSSASDLGDAIDEVITRYGHIHEKLGIRPHPDFDRYVELIFAICRHRNTTKDLIVSFDSALSRLNPQYRLEIDDTIQKALNSRGM